MEPFLTNRDHVDAFYLAFLSELLALQNVLLFLAENAEKVLLACFFVSLLTNAQDLKFVVHKCAILRTFIQEFIHHFLKLIVVCRCHMIAMK